jgi:sugar lactone lactonase YvrE
MFVALLVPAVAGAAFGPVTSFGGTGSANGQLSHPQSAGATNATVYVADTVNNRVSSFDPSGTFQGNLSSPPASPQDVATNGTLVVAAGPSQVVRWLAGVPLPFNPPGTSYGVAVDGGGTIYVSDTSAGVIHKFNALGVPQGDIGGGGLLANPQGLTTDPAGSLYVADTGHGRILKLDPGAGNVLGEWTMPTYRIVANGVTTDGRIDPHDVAVDGTGRIFAPDAGTHSNLVAVFGPGGDLQQVFGAPDSDPGNPCPVRGPWGLGTSPSGTLFVASTGEDRIRVFDEAHGACPFPSFGPGGGVTRTGVPGADRRRPKIKLTGFPHKCARHNFAFVIHASDDVQLSRLTLFVNHKRVANESVNKATWTVRVKMPAGKVAHQLPRGASARILISVRVKDASGKKASTDRAFRICGVA